MIIILLYRISYILNVVLSVFFSWSLQCDDAGFDGREREMKIFLSERFLIYVNAKIFYVRCFNFSLIVYLSFKYHLSMCNYYIMLVSPFRFSPVLSSFPFYLSLPAPPFPALLILSSYHFFFLFFLEVPPSLEGRRWWIDERASIDSSAAE